MKQIILTFFISIFTLNAFAQEATENDVKQRLDFARTYFELGGTFLPSFEGKRLLNNEIQIFTNPESVMQYLNWGGFHFWGHAAFYVTIPLSYNALKNNDEIGSELLHSVATGARFFPWAYQEGKLRPYVGLGWSALDFRQKSESEEEQTTLSKDFMLSYDTGLLYGYRNFSLRLGINYFPDSRWDYPLSRTTKSKIKTPDYGVQVGLLYAMDFSKRTTTENIEKWNSYPPLSKQSLDATKKGALFIGIGPSISYSLKESEYNQEEFPYLKEKLTSTNYFDIAMGYHFSKIGLFTALSFRNPEFETKGYGSSQSIKKTSLCLEVNKFLLDYSGFVPYVGLNVAYDKLKYTESIDDANRTLTFDYKIEPGVTFGWDIQPGKNQEALILRTNLRWYPFSSFEIDGKGFDFSQLEYNLIQLVFYPGRLEKKRK